MTPTNELRFVERWIPVPNSLGSVTMIRVLQQKWVDPHDKFGEGEWRDVPLVKEEVRREAN